MTSTKIAPQPLALAVAAHIAAGRELVRNGA